MFYTREQVQRLEKYRKTFETAVNSGFARNVGSIALKEIESIYDEAYGSHYQYNSGCSMCILSYLKRVGEPFLKDAKMYAAEDRAREAAEAEEAAQLVNNEPVVEEPELKEEESPVPEEPNPQPIKQTRQRRTKKDGK